MNNVDCFKKMILSWNGIKRLEPTKDENGRLRFLMKNICYFFIFWGNERQKSIDGLFTMLYCHRYISRLYIGDDKRLRRFLNQNTGRIRC